MVATHQTLALSINKIAAMSTFTTTTTTTATTLRARTGYRNAPGSKVERGTRESLVRSGSLGRLKQFPAYLCTRSCDAFPNVLLFLSAALSFVQSYIKQLVLVCKKHGLLIAVFTALTVLFTQFVACCIGLFMGRVPPGLVFMLCSLFFMALTAYKTFIFNTQKRPSRKLNK